MDLKEEQAIGADPASHWYYIAKGRAIRSLLGHDPVETILDVGAGSGVFSRMLTESGFARSALCVDPNYTDEWITRKRSLKIDYRRSVDHAEADLVLMIDVIEHVDDDVGLMADYAGIVPPGARFLISVPAFNSLWSSHDEFLEHRRRYTIATLRNAVCAAGLVIIDCRYFFGMLFPGVAALRLAARAMKSEKQAVASALKAAPAWLNAGLIAIHDIERRTLFPFNRLAGVTAFCLAEKPRILAKSAAAA